MQQYVSFKDLLTFRSNLDSDVFVMTCSLVAQILKPSASLSSPNKKLGILGKATVKRKQYINEKTLWTLDGAFGLFAQFTVTTCYNYTFCPSFSTRYKYIPRLLTWPPTGCRCCRWTGHFQNVPALVNCSLAGMDGQQTKHRLSLPLGSL